MSATIGKRNNVRRWRAGPDFWRQIVINLTVIIFSAALGVGFIVFVYLFVRVIAWMFGFV